MQTRSQERARNTSSARSVTQRLGSPLVSIGTRKCLGAGREAALRRLLFLFAMRTQGERPRSRSCAFDVLRGRRGVGRPKRSETSTAPVF